MQMRMQEEDRRLYHDDVLQDGLLSTEDTFAKPRGVYIAIGHCSIIDFVSLLHSFSLYLPEDEPRVIGSMTGEGIASDVSL